MEYCLNRVIHIIEAYYFLKMEQSVLDNHLSMRCSPLFGQKSG